MALLKTPVSKHPSTSGLTPYWVQPEPNRKGKSYSRKRGTQCPTIQADDLGGFPKRTLLESEQLVANYRDQRGHQASRWVELLPCRFTRWGNAAWTVGLETNLEDLVPETYPSFPSKDRTTSWPLRNAPSVRPTRT